MWLDDFMRLFQGRRSAFAQQFPDGHYEPVRREITVEDYLVHIAHDATYGIYIVDETRNAVRNIVFDIDDDRFDEFEGKSVAELRADALVLALQKDGVRHNAMSVEFSGRKGWHIWLHLEEWTPARDARRYGTHIANKVGDGCEVFPKGEVHGDGFGTLVKLPLAKHLVTGSESFFVRTLDLEKYHAPEDQMRDTLPLHPTEFARLLKQVPTAAPAKRTDYKMDALYPCGESILENGERSGARNFAMFALGLQARRMGASEDAALTLMEQANENFSPPLPRGVLPGKARSIYSSPEVPGFQCSRDYLHEGDEPHCAKWCPRYKEEYGRTREGTGRSEKHRSGEFTGWGI